MAKANAEATTERVDHLQGMILAGKPNTACLTYARQTWGVSRAQGYRLLKKVWAQIKDDIDESGIDRQELLSWSIQMLMAAAKLTAMYFRAPVARDISLDKRLEMYAESGDEPPVFTFTHTS